MSYSRRVQKDEPTSRPLYNISKDTSVQRTRRKARQDFSTVSTEAEDRRVHLVNADTLVSMVHDLCQQVAICNEKIHFLETQAEQQAGTLYAPQSPTSPAGRESLELKIDTLSKQLRSFEAASSSAEVQHDMELREMRSKITQIELLSTLPAAPAAPLASPLLPTTLYDPQRNTQPSSFIPEVQSAPRPTDTLTTYCKLLQRDLLDTIAEQARQKKVTATLSHAVESAEQNLSALRDYVVKLTNLGFPETTSATGFARSSNTPTPQGPPLLMSLFQRLTDVDHRVGILEREGVLRGEFSDVPHGAGQGRKVSLSARTNTPEIPNDVLGAMLDGEEGVADVVMSVPAMHGGVQRERAATESPLSVGSAPPAHIVRPSKQLAESLERMESEDAVRPKEDNTKRKDAEEKEAKDAKDAALSAVEAKLAAALEQIAVQEKERLAAEKAEAVLKASLAAEQRAHEAAIDAAQEDRKRAKDAQRTAALLEKEKEQREREEAKRIVPEAKIVKPEVKV